MDLQNIAATLARHLVLADGAKEELLINDVNWREWPDCIEAKPIFEKYDRITADKKHEAARLYLRLDVEKVFEKWGLSDLGRPLSLKECLAHYQGALKNQLVDELVLELSRNREGADEVISKYQTRATFGVRPEEIQTLGAEFCQELREQQAAGSLVRRLPDFPIWSDMIGGFNPGRFTVLYADTGFGKTNIALQLALSASRVWPTVYFNMEMIKFDFICRAIMAITGLTRAEVEKMVDETRFALLFQDRKLKITSGEDLPLEKIAATIIRERKEFGAEFFVVDYDQKIILEESRREDEWKQLQRAAVYLERIAIREKVHVLLLAQSNNKGEISGSNRMKFGAYTVMRFFNDELSGKDVIQCVKNRGGEFGATLEVVYDRARAWVREAGRVRLEKAKLRSI